MDQPRVQVLEEVHVAGVEAGVVVEIICGRDGERDIRQLHASVPNRQEEEEKSREGGRLQAGTNFYFRKEEEEEEGTNERRGTLTD